MTRKLRWLVIGVVLIAAFIPLVVFLGGMGLRQRFDRLSGQAKALGMPVDMPDRGRNEVAEAYRRKIIAFDENLGPETAHLSFYSESPKNIDFAHRVIGPILPTAYSLSECDSYGKSGIDDLRLEAWTTISYLYTDGNYALAKRDFPSVIKAARAMRLFTELVPSDDTIGAACTSTFAGLYACLLQRAAESTRTEAELESIAGEAAHWKLNDFSHTVRNSIAEEFDRIDHDVASSLAHVSPIERAQEMMWNTEPAKQKRKIFALKNGTELFPLWSDDKKIWKLSGTRDATMIEFFWGFIKEREFELRRSFASLHATLHARKAQLEGGPWPTIEELGALGVETSDPIFGKPYVWKDFEGEKRLYGNVDPRDPNENGFLLLSDDEQQRAP